MKTIVASLGLVFFSSLSFANLSVSDFTQSADKNFSFKMLLPDGQKEFTGSFRDVDFAAIESDAVSVKVKQLEKFIVIAAVNNGAKVGGAAKTANGSLFILEEMNSLYVPLTIAPIVGAAASLFEDGLRMIEISRMANSGDLATGVQKLIESFRQNPKLTVQSQLAKLATARPKNAPIAVGGRTRIQAVRSFEELEGGTAPPTTYVAKRRTTARKIAKKLNPAPVAPAAPLRTAQRSAQNRGQSPRRNFGQQVSAGSAKPTNPPQTYIKRPMPAMRYTPAVPAPFYY